MRRKILPLHFFLHDSSHAFSDLVGVTTKLGGGGLTVAETRQNAAAAILRFRPHIPPQITPFRLEKCPGLLLTPAWRESRGENGRGKPRREAGCSGKSAEK